MSKIIKKRIRRSLPALLIFTLVSLTSLSLIFNLNIGQKLSNSVDWGREAKADSASSTVTVRNAPPSFTVNAAESTVSSSTSPVNVGGSIAFNATADDAENNNYYLIICASDSVTAGAGGGAPSCGGTQFCVSSVTNDATQATCTYNSVADPSAETDDWYAFVCDNHTTEADCANSNQGSGDSGSPIYINHAPTLTSVSTTDDNKAPGGIFTIEAVAADSDVQGGADQLSIDVCDTNSWSSSTGCAGTTLCNGTSDSPNVSCQYTDTAPTADQTYTYYAFVKDWHSMAASGNSKSNTYTIINVAPTVSNITLNDGNNINLNIKGASAITVWATSTSITDNNGCTDLSDATSTIYMSNVAGGAECSANDNNCYKALAASCNISDCSGASDATATISCSASLAFHAVPTDTIGDNPYASYNWVAAVNAYDEALTGSGVSGTGVEVIASAALDVTEATIPYGIIQAGQNTGSYNATTTVLNFGNTPLNSDVSGTWMAKGVDTISEDNQEFDLSNFIYGAGAFALSSTTPETVNIVTPRPTSQSDIFDELYWGIGIPSGIPSGDYSGTNTFSAVLKLLGGNWN